MQETCKNICTAGVINADRHPSHIFKEKLSFSLVMQHSRKDVLGFVRLQRFNSYTAHQGVPSLRKGQKILLV